MIDIIIKKDRSGYSVKFNITNMKKYKKIRGKYERKHCNLVISSLDSPENAIESRGKIFIPGDKINYDLDEIFFDKKYIKDIILSFLDFKSNINNILEE